MTTRSASPHASVASTGLLLRRCCRRVSLAVVLVAIFMLQPRAMSYFGLNLMLQYAVPIAFATIAQMFIITVNDLDLSIGAFVGLVGLHRRHLAGRPAAARPAAAAALHRLLCRRRRAHPCAQPALASW